MKFKNITLVKYFKIFEKYLGWQIYSILILSMLAGLVEGFGLLAVLPLFNQESNNLITEIVEYIFNIFSISRTIISTTFVIVIIFIVKSIFVFSTYAVRAYLSGKLLYKIKYDLFNSFSRISYQYYQEKNTGHFTNIINEQTTLMWNAFGILAEILIQLINSLFYISFSLYLSWQFGFFAILTGSIFLLISNKMNKIISNTSRRLVKESKFLTQLTIQFVLSFKYIISVNKLNIIDQKVKNSINTISESQIRILLATGLLQAIREPFAIIFVLTFISINSLVFGSPIASLLASAVFFYKSISSITLLQLNRQKLNEKIGSLEMVNSELKMSLLNREKNSSKKIDTFSKDLRFKNISYFYPNTQKQILKKINLKINKNTTIAIIGESGSGKTTLVDLITLINKPTSGDIFIDGIHHNKLDLKTWRDKIGYLSQEPFLYSDSILNNVTLKSKFDDFIDKKLLIDCLKKANIYEFVESLPEKYNTFVGEGGMILSGGQKQRLCIARELYKKPNLLILDEATSSLDRNSEFEIQKSISSVKNEITFVIIAHRLETIKNADKIIIMDKGEIIDFGSYNEISNKEGSYINKILKL